MSARARAIVGILLIALAVVFTGMPLCLDSENRWSYALVFFMAILCLWRAIAAASFAKGKKGGKDGKLVRAILVRAEDGSYSLETGIDKVVNVPQRFWTLVRYLDKNRDKDDDGMVRTPCRVSLNEREMIDFTSIKPNI